MRQDEHDWVKQKLQSFVSDTHPGQIGMGTLNTPIHYLPGSNISHANRQALKAINFGAAYGGNYQQILGRLKRQPRYNLPIHLKSEEFKPLYEGKPSIIYGRKTGRTSISPFMVDFDHKKKYLRKRVVTEIDYSPLELGMIAGYEPTVTWNCSHCGLIITCEDEPPAKDAEKTLVFVRTKHAALPVVRPPRFPSCYEVTVTRVLDD